MTSLAERACEACRADSQAVSADEQTQLLAKLDGWVIDSADGIDKLSRTFDVTDFAAALALANSIGEIAEAEDHHPQLMIEWGRVDVFWWTHSIGGLHLNDFILAARCDALP